MTTPAPASEVRAVLTAAQAGTLPDPCILGRYHAASLQWCVTEGAITAAGQITDLGRRLLIIFGGTVDPAGAS